MHVQREMDRFMLLTDIVLLLLYSLTSILAILTNGFICRLSFQRRKHIFSQSPTSQTPSLTSSHIFLLNLALSDGLSGLAILTQLVFCSEYFLNRSTLCSYICFLSKSAQTLAYNTSIFTICLIAFDRYRIVQNPFQQYHRRKMSQMLFFLWPLSALFSLMSFISMEVPLYFHSYEKLIACQVLFPSTWNYFLSTRIQKFRLSYLILCFYLLPSSIIAILCLLTTRLIARRTIIGVQQFRTFEQSRTRSIRSLIIILFVFTLSHLPINYLYFRDLFLFKKDYIQCNDSTIYFLFYWLSISSCCHNPIIYSWFNRTYRNLLFNWYRSIIYCRRQT